MGIAPRWLDFDDHAVAFPFTRRGAIMAAICGLLLMSHTEICQDGVGTTAAHFHSRST